MKASTLAAAALLVSLAACGGKGDDALADNAAKAAEARADQLDTMADTASGSQEEVLEAQAEVTREVGKAREEAIDDADVNAAAMTPSQKDAIVKGQ
jgi:predicted small lipoprotein YifL